MRTFLVSALLLAAALAGCTSQDGNPDLRDGDPLPTGPTTTFTRSPTASPDPGAQDPSPTPTTTSTTTTGPPTNANPPIFELNVSAVPPGPAPVTVPVVLDIVSEHRSDRRQVYFTYTLDTNGDGQTDHAGDSRDFIERDENGTLQYEGDVPVYRSFVVNTTYDAPGIYNVTLRAERLVMEERQVKTETLDLLIQPGPSYDEICPTSQALMVGGHYVDSSDQSRWRETNGVGGLQRDDTGCPKPDTPA